MVRLHRCIINCGLCSAFSYTLHVSSSWGHKIKKQDKMSNCAHADFLVQEYSARVYTVKPLSQGFNIVKWQNNLARCI